MVNIKILIAFLVIVCLFSCNNQTAKNETSLSDTIKIEPSINNTTVYISRDSVLKIAEANAKVAYRDLSIYEIKAELKDDKWYVDYELNDPQMLGGGPHYIISAKTGLIDSCRYEQ